MGLLWAQSTTFYIIAVLFLKKVIEGDFCLHSAPDVLWKLGWPIAPLAEISKKGEVKISGNKSVISILSVFLPLSAACLPAYHMQASAFPSLSELAIQ